VGLKGPERRREGRREGRKTGRKREGRKEFAVNVIGSRVMG
jgi:hypothetical protein